MNATLDSPKGSLDVVRSSNSLDSTQSRTSITPIRSSSEQAVNVSVRAQSGTVWHKLKSIFLGGWTWNLLFAVIVINLSHLLYGYQTSMLNSLHHSITVCDNTTIILNTLQIPSNSSNTTNTTFFPPCLPITDFEWSFVISIIYIGGLVGNFVPFLTSKFISPLATIWFGNIPAMVGVIIMSLFGNTYMFIIGRFLIGFTGGITWNQVPQYLSDISPAELRGAIGVTPSLSHYSFALLSQLLGVFLAFHPGWRIVIGISAVIAIAQMILIPCTQNSPRWLIKHRYIEAAQQTLTKLRPSNPTIEFGRIEHEINKSERVIKKPTLWKRLCYPKVIKNTILMTVLYTFQPFTGANIIEQYSTDIFRKVNLTNPSVATVVTGVCNILAVIFSLLIVDRAGRRKLLILGTLGQSISFGIVALSYILTRYVSWFSWFSLIGVIGYLFTYAMALGPLIPLLITEMFPEDLEQFGVTFTTCINWLGCAGSTFLYPIFSAALGDYVFIPFFVLNVICFVIVIIFVPETKSKSLEELQSSMGYQEVDHIQQYHEIFNPHGKSTLRAQFVTFLQKEGDYDLFQFVLDVEELKQVSDQDREKVTMNIYNRYINPESDTELALSKGVITQIGKHVGRMDWKNPESIQIFDSAVRELQENQLMESYIRMKNLIL